MAEPIRRDDLVGEPARCRSCGAPIWWAMTLAGKRMPVDAEPASDGNLALYFRGDTGELMCAVATAAAERAGDRWVSHFATCRHARRWRRK